jgi:sulfur relay (sulfurtransferase) complex TusBCD TusD component (DsrE family)
MSKTFTLFLSTPPYMNENTLTAIKIAESALVWSYTPFWLSKFEEV